MEGKNNNRAKKKIERRRSMSEEAHAERQGIKRRIVARRHESGNEEAKMVALVIHRLSQQVSLNRK